MKTMLSRLLVATVLLLLIPCGVLAKKSFQWDPITAEDWNVAPDSSLKIVDAAVIFEKVLANDKKLQKFDMKRTIYRRIRILGPSGRDWADVDVPYLDEDQKVKNIYGRTVLRDGTEIALTKDHIFEKEKVKTKDFKLKQKTFSLPGVTDDCIIEYAIEYDLESWVPKWVVQEDIPVLRAELRWVLPEIKVSGGADWIIDFVTPNYLWLNTTSNPKITQLPNIKEPETLFFEIGYIAPFEEHPHAIPDEAQKTKLYCYYGSRKSPASYWGDYSVKLDESMQEFCEKNKRVKKLVERWSDLEDNEAKIAAAYEWVQGNILNLTYFDLYDDKGEEKEPEKIKCVSDVMKYKYGSRTRICMLFCDILREMNINAKMVYLKDRIDDLFVPEAKYWQMDHALVGIEDPPGTVRFFAPGHCHTPLGTVPWFCEGVDALVCGGSEYLVPIPFSTAQQNTSNVSYEFTIDEDLEVYGSMSCRLGGHDGRSERVNLTDEDSTDFASLLKEDLEEFVPLAEIDSVCCDKLDSCGVPFHVDCHLEYPPLSTVGNRILLKPLEYISAAENPFTDPDRSIPILFEYAYQLNESATLQLPEGYAVEGLPNDTTFENGAGRCAVKFQQMGNTLTAQRFFTLNGAFWSGQNYPAIKALFQARKDMSDQIVMLAESSETTGSTE